MKSFVDIFEKVKAQLELNITETAAELWFEPLKFVVFDNDTIVIDCGEEFVKTLVSEKYYATWQQALSDAFGFDVNIKFISTAEKSDYEAIKRTKMSQQDLQKETFENFVVGPSNKFAYSAAKAVASNTNGISVNNTMSYNPLFIYGNSGLGKTHLLNAIANRIKENDPSVKIIFVKAEEFTNEFLNHLSNKTTALFHDKYRNADIIIIDDIQFLAGKETTQEEFFHTIDSYIVENKQIILSSDRPPKDISTLADRIRGRIEQGLLADIQPPELETRINIIKNKCEIYDLVLDEDIIIYIAEKVKNNIRQLDGVVKKLKAYSNLSGDSKIVLSDVQNVIKNIVSSNQPIPQITEKIILEVSRNYNVSVDDLYSKKRDINISNPRQIAMYIMRNVTGMTFQEIGKKFDRNYSTVIHSISTVEEKIEEDSSLKAQISDIIKNVQEN
ncbi:MAG: chromosomal replication initiator protein DnaA [Clostridia bacterium]|nr:chromosomal replication initiator protein DnaA [Clostridia bacterium]